MRRLVGVALLAPVMMVGAQGAPDVEARPIALAEAVAQAQRNAPLAVQARGAMRSTAAATRTAYGAFIPSVTLTGGASRSTGSQFFQGRLVPLSGNAYSMSEGLSMTVDLFTGFRRLNDLRRAQADEDAADASELNQRYLVAFQVKQQYYAALAARESESAARAQVEQAEQQFRAAAARVTAGAATKSDSLRSVITVGNARLALLTAQNNLRVANAFLTRLVASPTPVTPISADTVDPGPISLDSAGLAAVALEGPAVRQSRAQLVSARAAARSGRATYLPTVSLTATSNGTSPKGGFRDGINNFGGTFAFQDALRLTFSYPLFNGMVREQTAITTSVAEDNATANLRDAVLLAQQQLAQLLGVLRTAQQQIAIQRASLAAAEEDLRVQQQRYSLGASTLLDVLTSQAALNSARAALIQARFDYRNAKAQLEQLVGRDL